MGCIEGGVWVGMGNVFQLVKPCIVLGWVNIDRRLRVLGVECVLALSTHCFNENTY